MYFPPSNSRLLIKMGKSFNFDQVLSEMTNNNLDRDHHVILLGDMNARVGDSLST